jgi:hypothetical protein
MTDREAAWDSVHEALPAGWAVGPPTFDPGVPGWSVTRRSVACSRLKPPATVTGTGADETAALRDLDDRLRGVPQPNGSRMTERERRIRLAYLEGAEAWSRQTSGRGLRTASGKASFGGSGRAPRHAAPRHGCAGCIGVQSLP